MRRRTPAARSTAAAVLRALVQSTLVLSTLVLGTLVLGTPVLHATAAAASAELPDGPCLENGTGPVCGFTYGTVASIADGDTLDVALDGQGTAHVRLNGVQAMEQTVYSRTADRRRGECHAVEATARLERLAARGTRVRLGAQHEASRSGARLRRSVFVLRDGRWRDVARSLLREGHGLWLPAGDEPAHNAEYDRLAQQARADRVGLWDSGACGAGPEAGARVALHVTWDANGADGVDLNGEQVQVTNRGRTPLPLGGWWLRDSAYRGPLAHGFVFPADTVVPAGGTVTVHVGTGRRTATRLYWAQPAPVFENVTRATGLGDGAYLFDPQGDLRSSLSYPCRTSCTDPLTHRIALTALHDPLGTDTAAGEKVTVRNTSSSRVSLAGYQLWSWPYGYTFPPRTVLAAGQSLEVRLSAGRSTGLVHHWGLSVPALGNDGDSVALRSSANVVVACRSWGRTSGCRTTD